MEFERLPEEFARPPMEPATAMEPKGMPEEISFAPERRCDEPREEFEGKSGGNAGDEGDGSRHGLVKKLMMMPVVTSIATLSIVFASYGVDPLGDDFLNHEGYHDYFEEHDKDHDKDRDRSSDHGHSDGRGNVREYPGDLTDAHVQVIYVPTGEEYYAEGTGEAALADAREWVERQGGDPDSLTYVNDYVTYQKKADGAFVGDEDYLEGAYDPFGNIHEVETLHVIYYAYASVDDVPADVSNDLGDNHGEPDDYGESDHYPFPELTNLDPDFEGNYASSRLIDVPYDGSEEFIRIYSLGDEDYVFLHAGQYWKDYEGITEETRRGISYDAERNVLTLQNFEAEILGVNLMGNGFTIELIGNSYVNQVTVWGYHYGGSVRFTGSGSLVINDHYASATGGLVLDAEDSESCMMVEDGVILEIYGGNQEQYVPAIQVKDSTMDRVIYYSPEMELYAKAAMAGSAGEGTEVKEGYISLVSAPDGTRADYVHFAPKE